MTENEKEQVIVMMRLADNGDPSRHVIEGCYVEIGENESTLDADVYNEVSMRITGPALLELAESISDMADRDMLLADQYKRGLIPCAYCGDQQGLQIINPHKSVYQVRCTCGTVGPVGNTKNEARIRWNRRAYP